MLIKQRAMKAFNDAVGLRSLHAGHAMGDILKLREQLIGVLVRPAAEFAAIVGKHRLDLRPLRLEVGRVMAHQDATHAARGDLATLKP